MRIPPGMEESALNVMCGSCSCKAYYPDMYGLSGLTEQLLGRIIWPGHMMILSSSLTGRIPSRTRSARDSTKVFCLVEPMPRLSQILGLPTENLVAGELWLPRL